MSLSLSVNLFETSEHRWLAPLVSRVPDCILVGCCPMTRPSVEVLSLTRDMISDQAEVQRRRKEGGIH